MRSLPSVRDVLARAHGELAPEAESLARAALDAHARSVMPWYLRLLVGLGAWIGAWFLLVFAFAFLAMVLEGAIEQAAIVMGAGLVAAGVGLRRLGPGELVGQLSLVASFTGQMLVIGGVGASSESVSAAALTALVLSAVLAVIVPDTVHRFACTVVTAVAVAVLLWNGRVPSSADVVAIGLVAVPLVAWRVADPAWRQQHAEALDPVAYGAIVSLLVGLLVDAGIVMSGLSAREWDPPGLPILVAVSGVLVWLAALVCAEHGVGPGRPETLAAGLAVVAFAAVTRSTPALIVTLMLVVLAFDRRRPLVVGLATAFFLGFGALYYYNLEMTLLAKSGVLVGSGLVCLAGCAILRSHTTQEAA